MVIKDIIVKHTKEIAEAEGYPDIKINFIKLSITKKYSTNGQCIKKKNKISFNKIFPFLLEHSKHCGDYRVDVWETLLHEIAHFKEFPFTMETHTDKEWKKLLRKGEYLDFQHNLDFWRHLRKLRKKYEEHKKQFLIDLK